MKSLIRRSFLCVLLLFPVVFTSFSGRSQSGCDSVFYLDTVLTQNVPVAVCDSMVMTLTDFSHKHAMANGPTKATAYITSEINGKQEEIMLSVHGNPGTVEDEYDSIIWRGYKIELIEFQYDRSVRLRISR